MKLSLEQLSARMRQGETIPSRQTAQVALALSIPSILEQLVVTAMGYIDAAMVGHIGAEATASIGIVSSSTWLLHGVLVGLYTALSIQIAQYLGADRQDDARSVLRQAMLFNVILGVGAALFGLGISPFLPGWLGADPSLRANATAYFAIWSTALPFTMAMGMYASILRAAGYALTASLISVLVCVLDAIFNFFLINPTRTLWGITVWGAGLGVPGAALGTALATVVGGLLALAILLLREGPLCIRKPAPWKITRSCLRNLLWVGGPLAGERAAISWRRWWWCASWPAWVPWPLPPTAWLSTPRACATWQATASRAQPLHSIGQAVGANRKDMAKRFAWLCTRHGHGHHDPDRCRPIVFAPALMSIFTADAAVIALGAQVLRIEALAEPMFGASIVAQRCHAGCGRQHRLLCAEPRQHVGHPADAGFPAGSPVRPGGRVGCRCAVELSIRGLLFLIRLARGRVAGKGRAVLNQIDKSKKERTLSRPFFFVLSLTSGHAGWERAAYRSTCRAGHPAGP